MRGIVGACSLAGAVLLAAATPLTERPHHDPTISQKVRIVAVHGKRTLAVGVVENYNIETNPGATLPIDFYWDAGDGVFATGRAMALEFRKAGRYTLFVTARNRYGTDTDTLRITAVASSAPGNRPNAPATDAAPDDTATDDASPATHVIDGPPGEAPNAYQPTRRGLERAGLRASQGIVWAQGGYSWVVATHLHQQMAELDVLRYRKQGYSADVFVDTGGAGSTAYRVVVGQFATPESALRVRSLLPDSALGIWLLKLPEIPPQ